MNIKKIVLTLLAFLFLVSCQTKEEKAISFFKKEINTEFKKYNSYIGNFKNSLENLRIIEFDVIANDSTPREYSKPLNDYWMLKSNNEDILQKIKDIERNISIADSTSTKIITLNDSLLKYNVTDSLINLKFSKIKVNNKKILKAKYYNTEVKRLLKLKDNFYYTIENIVVDGGWKTTGYLMNTQSSMKFYKYEKAHRFQLRYGGIITDGYSYKETTADEIYDLSNPKVFLSNTGESVLQWNATSFSGSVNGGRISFDKNIGKGSKLQITLKNEYGEDNNYGNYIRYWFGNDNNSYYGTYKLEGKQKDIIREFFNIDRVVLDLEPLDIMEDWEVGDLVIKTREAYFLEYKNVDLNEFINDFTNDIESKKGSVKISYNETNYDGEIETIASSIVIGENNEIKSDKSYGTAPNGKINSIEVVTTSIGNLYKFNYTYELEYSRGTEIMNVDMYILSAGNGNHSYVWTNGNQEDLIPSKINL